MSVTGLRVYAGAYRDSLLLLSASRSMRDGEGVEWATAAMAAPATVDDLAARGFPSGDLDGADANDLVLAVRAGAAEIAGAALDRGRAVLFAEGGPGAEDRLGAEDGPGARSRRTVADALAQLDRKSTRLNSSHTVISYAVF